MTDRLVAAISMAALIAFTGVLVGFVKELDLMIVIVVALGVGIYDFWKTLRRPSANDNRAE